MKKTNAMKWGIWGAAIGGAAITCATLFSTTPVTQTAYSFVVGGFVWGWLIANLNNWLGDKMSKSIRQGQ